MKFYYVAVLALIAIGTTDAASKLPKHWKTCRRTDPKLNECLKIAVTDVLKDLKNAETHLGPRKNPGLLWSAIGLSLVLLCYLCWFIIIDIETRHVVYPWVKELQGNQALSIPPIDPIHLDQITLKQGAGTAVGITLTFKNLIIHGLSKGKIEKVDLNIPKRFVTVEFKSDGPMKLEADYTSKGRILLIPINGVGKSTLIFDNFKANVKLHCKIVKKASVEHLDCQRADIGIDTTRLHLNFKRTQNINEGLGQNMNTFLNENWREILQDLKPAISKEFGTLFTNYANAVFSKVPLDEISPPN